MLRGFLDSGRFKVSGYYSEIESYDEQTLVANLPSFKQKPPCDVLVGSFYNPSLVAADYYRDIMHELRPAISLVEMPASLHRDPEPIGSYFGYKHEWYVLDAVDYLVPQHRKRCWVVSIDRKLVGPNFKIGSPQPRNHPLTVRDAIGDLPMEAKFVPWNNANEHRGLSMHNIITPTANRDRYDTIPPGSSADAIPVDMRPPYRKDNIGPSDIYGRLMWNYPAQEITPRIDANTGRFIHPQWAGFDNPDNVNRLISPLEAARLQTFPDSYVWMGNRHAVLRQIGQATPPAQAMCWAHYLADLLDTDQ